MAAAASEVDPGHHIADYLVGLGECVEDLYRWELPANLVANRQLIGSPFEQTTQLKSLLQDEFAQAESDAERCDIARVWIKEWGQIRQLQNASIEEMVVSWTPLVGRPRPLKHRFPFERISSWSKWLALICPSWAAIYDSRVVYSINAIHFMAGAEMRALPSPPSDNRTMKLLDASTLLLAARLRGHSDLSPAAIKRELLVSPHQAYRTYLDWLGDAHARLWPRRPLDYTEMLLFALADTRVFHDLAAYCARRGDLE